MCWRRISGHVVGLHRHDIAGDALNDTFSERRMLHAVIDAE
jgi:hypothetical protein